MGDINNLNKLYHSDIIGMVLNQYLYIFRGNSQETCLPQYNFMELERELLGNL
jgi:hypothetical protein